MASSVFNRPAKEQVRAWLARRRLASGPPPCGEEIRLALGWGRAGNDVPQSGTATPARPRAPVEN